MPIKDKRTKEISPQKFIEENSGIKIKNNGDIVINPVKAQTIDATLLKAFFDEIDVKQCTSRIGWENIPFKGVTSLDIERMRYYRGELGNQPLLGITLPTFHGGNYDYYGHCKSGGLTTYYGPYKVGDSKNVEKILNSKQFDFVYDGYKDIYTKEDLEDKIIVLPTTVMTYNGIPYYSRYALNQVIIKEMIELFKRISNNVVVSSKKLIIKVKDGNTIKKIYKDLKGAFDSDNPFVVLADNLEVESFQNQSDLSMQEYFTGIKQYDNLRCLASGISTQSYGNQKKERNITEELNDVDDKIDTMIEQEMRILEEWAEAVNKAMGTKDFRPVLLQRNKSDEKESCVKVVDEDEVDKNDE